MKVGFVGLGRMGSAIAGRLADSGTELTVWNRSAGKAEELVDRGATAAPTLGEACDGSDVVMTMLADDEALRSVTLGDGGIAASMGVGGIHVAMGTHGVQAISELAGAHANSEQTLVSAPVLGRPDVAASGGLGIVVAGQPDAVERCRPLFEAIGKRIFEAGERPESATAIKLANNFTLGCAIETMSEAFGLVGGYGVQASTLHEVLTEGLFSAPAYKVYGQIMVDSDFDQVGFTTALAVKDVELVLSAADAAGAPLPSARVLRERLLSAIENGDGDRDWAVLALEQERQAK